MGKGLLIGVIVVILLIGAGITIWKLMPKELSDYSSRAIKENNISICLEIETDNIDRFYPMDCFRQFADSTNNILICQQLEDRTEINNCYTAFIHTRWDYHQETLCDKLPSEDLNYCYLVTAIAKNDQSFCENIGDSELIEDCKGNVVEQNQ